MKFRNLKKSIVSLILAFAVAAMVFCGTLSVSAENYRNWKQYDDRWSTIVLGKSGDNMQKIGCAVTATAMLIRHSGCVTDESFTPARLVRYLNDNNGFDASGNLMWYSLTGIAPGFNYVYPNDSLRGYSKQQITEKIRSLLADGYYLLVNVNYGGHFVAVESVTGSTVNIMDPGGEGTSLFDSYSLGGIYSLRKFRVTGSTGASGSVPEPTMENAPFPGLENPPFPGLKNPPAPEPTEPEMTNPPAPVTPPAPEQVTEPTEPELENPPMPEQVTAPEAPPLPAETETTVSEPPVIPEPELPMEPPPMPPQASAPDAPALPEGLEKGDYISAGLLICPTKTLVLRELPDAYAPGSGIVLEGTVLQTTWIAMDYSWAMVIYQDTVGWIPLEYTNF